ncbi:MAG: GNAT family N-acetyltransferase [Longispora sp.]|nr:GNAT family N-acetyltransferase [Longispora sp. (in: high G+C Gram-positive bacteria)]
MRSTSRRRNRYRFGWSRGDVLVGTIDVQLRQPYLGERQANVAYGLYPAWRGRGLATRAVLLAVEFARQRIDVDEVVIRAESQNPSSIAVAQRAGFQFSHISDDDQGRFDWYVLAVAGGAGDGHAAEEEHLRGESNGSTRDQTPHQAGG